MLATPFEPLRTSTGTSKYLYMTTFTCTLKYFFFLKTYLQVVYFKVQL